MQQTTSRDIKALSVLHIAMFMGQLLFLIIAVILVYLKRLPSSSSMHEYPQQIILFCGIVATIGYITGKGLFNRKLQQINDDYRPIAQKMNDYRAASIMRWAMLEGPALLGIIFFLLTNNSILLIIVGLLLAIFFSTRPTPRKIAKDLSTSEADIENNNPGIDDEQ